MSNMSYIRFENTLTDLIDCKEALDQKKIQRMQRLRTKSNSRTY